MDGCFVTGMNIGAVTLSVTFAEVRAKACMNPSEMTDAELLEMSAFHELHRREITRFKLLQELTGFDYSWQDAA